MSAPKVGDHEYEVRPLAVEVPYLYAQAVGLAIFGKARKDVGVRIEWDR